MSNGIHVYKGGTHTIDKLMPSSSLQPDDQLSRWIYWSNSLNTPDKRHLSGCEENLDPNTGIRLRFSPEGECLQQGTHPMIVKSQQAYKLNMYLRHGPVVIGDVLYPPGGIFGPRIQRDYQLVVIHKGALRLRLDEQWIEVAESDGILLGPRHRELFHFAADRETHHSWIAISPRFVSPAIRKELEQQHGPVPFLGRMSSLLELARQEPSVSKQNEALREEFYRGLAIATICDFASAARNEKGPKNPHAATLDRLERCILKRYAEPINLLQMAQEAGVSRQHLLRLCRDNARGTPTEQLYVRRLEVAADLLLQTGLSIAETAEQCGFVNQFHFSRKFKQTYACSPFEWRTRFWSARVRNGKENANDPELKSPPSSAFQKRLKLLRRTS